jgi:hypothetical protein
VILVDFLAIAWVGALALGAMCVAAAIVEAVGRRRLADALRLDLGPGDEL